MSISTAFKNFERQYFGIFLHANSCKMLSVMSVMSCENKVQAWNKGLEINEDREIRLIITAIVIAD